MLRVLYFASVREAVGTGEELLDVPPDAATVSALVDWLAARDAVGAEALADRGWLRAAVDQAFVAMDATIVGAREVALFPPVTGG